MLYPQPFGYSVSIIIDSRSPTGTFCTKFQAVVCTDLIELPLHTEPTSRTSYYIQQPAASVPIEYPRSPSSHIRSPQFSAGTNILWCKKAPAASLKHGSFHVVKWSNSISILFISTALIRNAALLIRQPPRLLACLSSRPRSQLERILRLGRC